MRGKITATGGFVLLLAALGLGLPAASWAQSYGSESGQSGQVELNQEQIQTYAAAASEVQGIREQWVPRIRQAEGNEQQAQLRQQATREMMDAIEQKGLSVQQYNAITKAAQENPELRRRITEQMRQ